MIHPRHAFDDAGQANVFRFFDELAPPDQDELTRQAVAIDLEEIDRLVETLVRSPGEGNEARSSALEPADFIPLPENGGDAALWSRAREAGEA
ncbi:MAG: UDPGP type 1 family protein, partial [Akkermansiaceae bacterium]|nr:UDPGP type 1 family protein [Akkermansiaceae bacterium]